MPNSHPALDALRPPEGVAADPWQTRALTIRQPGASLIAAGVQTIHTDKRPTSYRGAVLIRSEERPPLPGFVGSAAVCEENGRWVVESYHLSHEMARKGTDNVLAPLLDVGLTMPLGAVVAVADLTDCVPIVAEQDLRLQDLRLPVVNYPPTAPIIAIQTNGCEGDRPPALTWLSWYNTVSPGRYIDAKMTDGPLRENRPFGDFTPGRWAWLLDNVRPINPIPTKGRQGLWRPDADLTAAALRDLTPPDPERNTDES